MVDVVDSGVLLHKTADDTAVTYTSPAFRDRSRSGRTVVYVYCSVGIAAKGIRLKVKDPTGEYRRFLEGPSTALTGADGSDMAHIIVDGPFGEGKVEVNTSSGSKNLYVWFESA